MSRAFEAFSRMLGMVTLISSGLYASIIVSSLFSESVAIRERFYGVLATCAMLMIVGFVVGVVRLFQLRLRAHEKTIWWLSFAVLGPIAAGWFLWRVAINHLDSSP